MLLRSILFGSRYGRLLHRVNYSKCPPPIPVDPCATDVKTVEKPEGSVEKKPDGSDKDGGKWTRMVRPLDPGKVRLGFIPDEWFTYFYPKTGVTGPYTFGLVVAITLFSKEIYVMEHEFYSGLSVLIMCTVAVKSYGARMARYLDRNIDAYERHWVDSRNNEKKYLQESIAYEEESQKCLEGQLLLIEAKRENVALQLEAAYRTRLVQVHEEVKKRLDHQVEVQNIHRRIMQKNLCEWVICQVMTTISGEEQEKIYLERCFADLEALKYITNEEKS